MSAKVSALPRGLQRLWAGMYLDVKTGAEIVRDPSGPTNWRSMCAWTAVARMPRAIWVVFLLGEDEAACLGGFRAWGTLRAAVEAFRRDAGIDGAALGNRPGQAPAIPKKAAG
jgi:hypothetical protein